MPLTRGYLGRIPLAAEDRSHSSKTARQFRHSVRIMSDTPAPSIFPTMRYKDARAAIDFLVRAFGFAEEQVHEFDGTIMHAELSYGNGMIIVGTFGVGDPMFDSRPDVWSFGTYRPSLQLSP